MTGLTPESFEHLWAELDADAQATKFSQQALLRLIEFYRALEADGRAVVDKVLTGWVLEGDPRRRFDALALIDEFVIREALPSVRTALQRLERATDPSAPTDRAKLQRLLARLEASEARNDD